MFDHETNASFLIRVRVTDDQGGILDREFTVSVTDVNESPEITEGAGPLSATVLEDGGGYQIDLNGSDPDGDSLTWSLGGSASNGTALIDSGTGLFSYSSNANYHGSESLVVNLSDGNLSDSITINLTITQVNDVPSDLNVSGSLTVLENESVGTQVGVFSATDADSNATHTFTLYDSNASTANSQFTMESNGTLLTGSVFDLSLIHI